MECKGLFQHWLEIEKRNKTQMEAINELNSACGTSYTQSWPSKMKGRNYTLERIPTQVRKYMMVRVLPCLLKDFNHKDYEKLVNNLI